VSRFAVAIIVSNICGGNLTATRNPSYSDDDNEFLDIDELLSGMNQKNDSAIADSNSDDSNHNDDLPDIGDLPSGVKQKSVPASANSNHGNMAEKVDNGTRCDSPLDSGRSAEVSTQGKHTEFSLWPGLLTHTISDPIILSDDESTGAEFDTDYTDPEICKSFRTIAPIRLASTACTASAALRSSAEPQSRAQITALGREMVDDGSADDSDDGDSGNRSDATGSQRGCRPRKRARRAKDTENDIAAIPSHPPSVLCQAAEATSCGMQESEEIPIHGSLTLKIVESKIVYCFAFSQESSPLSPSQKPPQDSPTDLEERQSAASIIDPTQEWGIRQITGQKIVGGKRHFEVDWKKTWMPESELATAKEMLDTFITGAGRKRPQKRGRLATGLVGARDEEEPKKRRGRPRKQT
jgi:hypothetical protein